jgi:hypothetical protein
VSFGPYQPYLVLAFLLWLLLTLARAGGRLAPRAALAPLLFLVTRPAVLVAWAIGAVAMIWVLVPQAVAHGHTEFSDYATMGGLGLFCGLGLAVPFVGVPFFVRRAFAPVPVFELEQGEILLYEVPANHFLSGESRGGKALVTTRRLGFRPHRFNVQVDLWSVRLEDLRSLTTEGERFLVIETVSVVAQDWLVVARPQALADYVGAIAKTAETERLGVNDVALRAAKLKG